MSWVRVKWERIDHFASVYNLKIPNISVHVLCGRPKLQHTPCDNFYMTDMARTIWPPLHMVIVSIIMPFTQNLVNLLKKHLLAILIMVQSPTPQPTSLD